MMKKVNRLSLLYDIAQNMGLKYILFRLQYLFQFKVGLFNIRFPINPKEFNRISRQEWLNLDIPFFISKQDISYELDSNKKNSLEKKALKILNHNYTFFGSKDYKLGPNYDWITNPVTGYKYDINKHWSEIEDYSKSAGDIKYVWEKARFTFIYDLIRYDFHFNKDSSEFIFSQIEDFIIKNPINQGPNYKCSQEISIRILNWTFALFYYRTSSKLTDDIFRKIMNSVYWQLKHIYSNINFSRIAVRNNHAITETSMLYLSKYLFPFISESKKWSGDGQKWLLREIDYQIYNDGSYLQFSHNYQRVVIQTLCWVLKINQLHNISFPNSIIKKLITALDFLYQQQDQDTGWLPNYGNNDGALFFPLNNHHYRDFRPQLQLFGLLLNRKTYNTLYEDASWFGLNIFKQSMPELNRKETLDYSLGGYYGFRDNALTTIRCGSYKDRPFQADALNLDIWYNGTNIVFDPGTYKYNTESIYLSFYNGTKGHNTLTIGDCDQMLKGGRFIWYYWTKNTKGQVNEYEDRFEFDGNIEGFPLYGKGIIHQRKIIKFKNKTIWKIIDKTNYSGNERVTLHWNINPVVKEFVEISAVDSSGSKLTFASTDAWMSEMYGKKEGFKQKICHIPNGYCETTIHLNIDC